MNLDQIFDFMVKFRFTFYDDLFDKLLNFKTKSKSLTQYLNHCYGSYKTSKINNEDLYLQAHSLEQIYPFNIRIENDNLNITILNTTYNIVIGYIFINNKITLSQYPILLRTFLKVPKTLFEKTEEIIKLENTSFLQEKDKLFNIPNPCLEVRETSDITYANQRHFVEITKSFNNIKIDTIKEIIIKCQTENRKIYVISATPMANINVEIANLIKLLEPDKDIEIVDLKQKDINLEQKDINLSRLEEMDIELIIQQTGCSKSIAIQSYIKYDRELVNTIMSLSK